MDYESVEAICTSITICIIAICITVCKVKNDFWRNTKK